MQAQPRSILLTGGAGFVGPLLARAVAREWPQARRAALTRAGESAPSPDWSLVVADLTEPASIEAAIESVAPDLVLHLAAQSSIAEALEGAQATWAVNCLGAFHLGAALARHAPAATVLFVSSGDVYGGAFAQGSVDETAVPQPLNAYARSKLAAEGVLRDVLRPEARLICARSFNHTGPRQDRRFVLPSFAAQIAAAERGAQEARIKVGNLDARRDFLHVDDVVEAYMALLRVSHTLPRRALYNVASGRAHTIGSLLHRLLAHARTRCETRVDPTRLRPSDVPLAVGDAGRLREATGWRPQRSLDVMLCDLLDYWRGQPITKSPSKR